MKIIDSHMHFWNPALLRYDWIQGEAVLNRPFLPPDFRADAAPLEISGLVFVQADCLPEQGLEEVKWITQLAAEIPIRAIVAFAPLEQGDAVRPLLEALRAYPLVKGARRLIQSGGAGFATQPAFVQGVKALADYGLSFDICVRHHQLPDAIALVAQCPDVEFILDHIGKPAIAACELSPWRENIQALAAYPNVYCKLSGLLAEANPTDWTPDQLRPYARVVLDAFGSRRVMFGSDWPVVRLAASYPHWVAAAQQLINDLPAADQQRIFFENAREFYRLDA